MQNAFQGGGPHRRYEVREKIGAGGSGAVYKAWDTQLQRVVSYKRLTDIRKSAEANLDQTWREAMTLAAVQHPNILTIYDSGLDGEGAYVVTEYLDGEDLESIVKREPYTVEPFVEAVQQILSGVIAAHQTGMIHRDLKPSNVMAVTLPTGEMQYKILDFGLAKFISEPTAQTREDRAIFGSVLYMAPEQFRFEPLDARTDIYGLACLFYFMLSGREAFDRETFAGVIAAHTDHAVTPLKELCPDVPSGVCDWVMWLMNAEPEDRPDSAEEALNSLMSLVRGETPAAAFTQRVIVHRRNRKRQAALYRVGLIVAVVAAGLTGGYLFWSDRAAEPAPASFIWSGPPFAFVESFDGFGGLGLSPDPQPGQLDASGWQIEGLRHTKGAFGVAQVDDVFARGLHQGAVEAGGLYAFEPVSGNRILGVKPSNRRFAPGAILLRLENQSATTLAALEITYTLWVLNREDRSSELGFEVWKENGEEPLFAGDLRATPEAGDPSTAWESAALEYRLENLALAPGEAVVLRWTGRDASGSGGRDAFGIDDVRITAEP